MRSRGLLKLLFFLVVVILLVRVFPLVIRLIESAAMGARQFWWVILIFLMAGLIAWVLKKRL